MPVRNSILYFHLRRWLSTLAWRNHQPTVVEGQTQNPHRTHHQIHSRHDYSSDQIIIHGPVLEHYNNAGRACVKHSKKRREGSVGATCKKLALGALRCGHAGCRKCSVCVCVICPSPLIAAYAVATVRGPIALILKRSFSEERTAKNEIALIQKNFHPPCNVLYS